MHGHLAPRVIPVSTHAPLAGSDLSEAEHSQTLAQFQPTLPLRGATYQSQAHDSSHVMFQPTLPLRGATSADSQATVFSYPVSTHAPLAGSDA